MRRTTSGQPKGLCPSETLSDPIVPLSQHSHLKVLKGLSEISTRTGPPEGTLQTMIGEMDIPTDEALPTPYGSFHQRVPIAFPLEFLPREKEIM